MQHHSFNPGTEVNIIGQAGGRFVQESVAVILELCERRETYIVRFIGDNRPVQRFVDPGAQGANLTAYLDRLNNARHEMV